MLGWSVRYARNNELYMTDTIIQSCLGVGAQSPSGEPTNQPRKEGNIIAFCRHHITSAAETRVRQPFHCAVPVPRGENSYGNKAQN